MIHFYWIECGESGWVPLPRLRDKDHDSEAVFFEESQLSVGSYSVERPPPLNLANTGDPPPAMPRSSVLEMIHRTYCDCCLVNRR